MKLSLVIPTFNESENLPRLIEELSKTLAGINHEIIVVDDDSPDETWKLAQELSKNYPGIRVVRRVGERGLSSAVLEGFRQAEGDVLGVMDADLSHPPTVIPEMFSKFSGDIDLAVASRYVAGGGVEDWPRQRYFISKAATLFARSLTSIHDPMSGCFMIRKKCFSDAGLNPRGFKILLEVLVKTDYGGTVEVPYMFRNRFRGESKLGANIFIQYIQQLISLYLYKLRRK